MTPGVFIPDRECPFYLLARHRQPLAPNVARAYIQSLTAPGDLVVDPFAASPVAARLAAQVGRRAIAVDSNPIVAFAARLEATLPAPREIEIALARWGEAQKENVTLRAHIEGQYATVCANCGGAVTADYFIWARDLNLPAEKVYRCPRCGPRRDPTAEADRTRAAEFKPRGFQYHLLLERLAAGESPHYNLLRERLTLYTPRNLDALVNLTLKLETAVRNDAMRDVLLGCLLHALDVGTSLYGAPDALPERKPPETFVEMNIWSALEAAATGLAQSAPGGHLAPSPEAVASGTEPALYVGHGSAHAVAQNLGGRAALILSSPARLDPIFWELSYLWTRWLLGKQASRSLEPFLEEERQRWGWYGTALTASLRDAAQLLRLDGHLVAAFPAGSHAMIEALVTAAAPSFQLEALTFRPHRGATASTEFGALRGDYRLTWSPHETNPESQSAHEVALEIRIGTRRGASEILSARAEPLSYSWLHHSALQTLARGGTLAATLAAPMHPRDNPFQFLRRELDAGLKEGYSNDLDHWQEEKRVLWMQQTPADGIPLADRVEQVVREIIEREGTVSRDALEDRVLERFPGLLTPEIELVEACARAYANPVDDGWQQRRENDTERERVREQANELGRRLGFEVRNGKAPFDLVWRDEKIIPASSHGALAEERIHEDAFLLLTAPHIDLGALLRRPVVPLQGLVLVETSQVELLTEKLRRLPTLARALHDAGWEFLRVSLIPELLAIPTLNRAEFQLALGLEPPLTRDREQLPLL